MSGWPHTSLANDLRPPDFTNSLHQVSPAMPLLQNLLVRNRAPGLGKENPGVLAVRWLLRGAGQGSFALLPPLEKLRQGRKSPGAGETESLEAYELLPVLLWGADPTLS